MIIDRLLLHTTKGFILINIEDIEYCSSIKCYVQFHLHNGQKLIITKRISDAEKYLSIYGFIRIHNRYLVNISHISIYINGRGGLLIMTNGDKLRVSNQRKQNFLTQIDTNTQKLL